jgi:DNA polymerase V
MGTTNASEKIFGLVDCNNFFVSCERVFNVSLRQKPVVVLSNNDGCIISRSNEAKKLGIPMGAPLFEWQKFMEKNHVAICSANFTMYADFSRRVAETLAQFAPEIEKYSVDEVFLAFDRLGNRSLSDYGKHIKAKVEQWVGIPVTVGIGPTKTLTKLANDIAKVTPELRGSLNMMEAPSIDKLIEDLPVGDVWGIGYRLSTKLTEHGYKTALDLKHASDGWIKDTFGITVLRTVWELRGIACLPLKEVLPAKKGITVSRSFGEVVATEEKLREAVAFFATRGAEKLRGEGSSAGTVSVFVSLKQPNGPPGQGVWSTVQLPMSTNYTPMLIHFALRALEQVYRPRCRYVKAGIMFGEIVPAGQEQMSLGVSEESLKRQVFLMQTMDAINHRWGARAIQSAAIGTEYSWKSRHNRMSPCYTTRWDEVMHVR